MKSLPRLLLLTGLALAASWQMGSGRGDAAASLVRLEASSERQEIAEMKTVRSKPVRTVSVNGRTAKAVAGEVVAKITNPDTVASLGKSARPMSLPGFYRVSMPVEQHPQSAARDLAKLPGVEHASPDFVVSKALVPNDSLYATYQWNMPKIEAPAAWDKTTGTASVIIANLDTGVNFNHEDLSSKVWTNGGETPSNGIDDDANGYVDDHRGMDFVNGTKAGSIWTNSPQGPIDDEGHGSLTASVTSGTTNNAKGIAGVDWQARIQAVKVLDTYGSGSLSDVAEGIRYAADNGAKVINMSLGALGIETDLATDSAISYANGKGVIIVAASGNDGSNTQVDYPAINPMVIAVGASDSSDQRASYSNAGPSLSLVAPGSGIASAYGVMEQPSGLSVSLQTAASSLSAGAYRYVVTAYNANGETIPSQPPSGNPNQNLANVTDGQQVSVTWSSVFGATGYKVYRTAVNGASGTEKLLINVGNVTSYVDNGSVSLGTAPPPGVNKGLLNTNYATANGTSLATPHVAGVAGLLLSLDATLTPSQVRNVLQTTADKVPGMSGQDRTDAYGYGRLNASRAVNSIQTYSAQWIGQSAPPTVYSGETGTAYVDFKNIGTQTWSNTGTNPVRLGTSNPRDRSSSFQSTNWINSARPSTFSGKVVAGSVTPSSTIAPGETARFEFNLTAPSVGSETTLREYFQPVAEGVQWLEDYGVFFDVTVKPVGMRYSSQWAGQSGYASLGSSDQTTMYIDYKNIGTAIWRSDGNNPVRLGTTRKMDRASLLSSKSWLNPARPASFSGKVSGGSVTPSTTIAPGETGRFEFTVTAPPVGGAVTIRDYFQPVAEGITWMEDYGVFFDTAITPKTYQYAYAGQSGPGKLTLGAQGNMNVDLTNTGTATWRRDTMHPVLLGTSRPQDRASTFATAGWLNNNRPTAFAGKLSGGAVTNQDTIAPGETARFTFPLEAKAAGLHKEYYQPVIEGFRWMNDIGIYQETFVPNPGGPAYAYQYITQNAIAALAPGSQGILRLQLRNLGHQPWVSNGATPVRLGADRPRDRSSGFYANGEWLAPNRIHLTRNLSDPTKDIDSETTVMPGDVAEFEFEVTAPAIAGQYREYFTPVADGVTWMPDIGIYWLLQVQ